MIIKFETLLKITLFSLFSVFALSFSIFPILAEVFTLLKWVMLFFFIFVSFFLSKSIRFYKNYSFISYLGFVCVLIISSFFKNGFSEEIIPYAFPFVFALFFYFLPKFVLNKTNSEFILDGYLFFSKVVFLSFIPLVFIGKYYIMGRFSGWFQNTNIIAGLSTLSILLVFYNIVIEKKNYIREILFLLLFLLILLLTQSRGALVASVVGCILVFLSSIKDMKSFIQSCVIIMVVGGSILFLINTSSFNESIKFRELELGIRGEMIDRQLYAFQSSPLIGVGVVENEDDLTSRLHSETSYTDILSMGGIIGALLLICAFFLRIKSLDNKSRLAFLTILFMSFSEGYITGIGGIVSLVFYMIFISGR